MRSMTGYASASRRITLAAGDRSYALTLAAELKSFNNKFLELSLSLPSFLYPFESAIRSRIEDRLHRGKVYARIVIEAGSAPVSLRMDDALLDGVASALKAKGVADPVAAAVTAVPFDTLFTLVPASLDESSITPVYDLVTETADALNESRLREGEATRKDFLRIHTALMESLAEVRTLAEGSVEERFAALKADIRALLDDVTVDEQRLVVEAGLIANRININEELKRLESHLVEYRRLLDDTAPVSKRLEFLSQELLRETNTIGSKVQKVEITRVVVTMKALVEELKEQVRNVE